MLYAVAGHDCAAAAFANIMAIPSLFYSTHIMGSLPALGVAISGVADPVGPFTALTARGRVASTAFVVLFAIAFSECIQKARVVHESIRKQ